MNSEKPHNLTSRNTGKARNNHVSKRLTETLSDKMAKQSRGFTETWSITIEKLRWLATQPAASSPLRATMPGAPPPAAFTGGNSTASRSLQPWELTGGPVTSRLWKGKSHDPSSLTCPCKAPDSIGGVEKSSWSLFHSYQKQPEPESEKLSGRREDP